MSHLTLEHQGPHQEQGTLTSLIYMSTISLASRELSHFNLYILYIFLDNTDKDYLKFPSFISFLLYLTLENSCTPTTIMDSDSAIKGVQVAAKTHNLK